MVDYENVSWQQLLADAVRCYMRDNVPDPDGPHSTGTANRVVRAFKEFVSGYADDEKAVLQSAFVDTAGYDGMVMMRDIPIMTMCQHHILPIIGAADFAYIPDGRVVGLSKIPRFINILCRRLQIQENLTVEIAGIFQDVVMPKGCAVNIRAVHLCMAARGVRVRDTFTETRALRGVFDKDATTKAEFMASVGKGFTIG